jgi:hypothetical protein
MGSILKIEDTFSKEIEELCRKRKDSSIIDVVLELCEKYEIEPESVAKLVNKPLKERMRAEFEQRNMMKGGRKTRLPLD